MRRRWLLTLLGLTAPAWALATDPPEDLPPPLRDTPQETREEQSVLVNAAPASRSPSIEGFGLIGPSGRHYIAGGVALADYVRDGQRQIVQLEAEDPARRAAPDENFLYFRETRTGHRWAIARYPSPDRRYRVYFQDAVNLGVWQLFQRAAPTWEQPPGELWPTTCIWPEPTCGQSLLIEPPFFRP